MRAYAVPALDPALIPPLGAQPAFVGRGCLCRRLEAGEFPIGVGDLALVAGRPVPRDDAALGGNDPAALRALALNPEQHQHPEGAQH